MLEVIHIHEHHRNRLTAAFAAAEFLTQIFHQHQPVIQPGKRVRSGHVRQLLIELLQFVLLLAQSTLCGNLSGYIFNLGEKIPGRAIRVTDNRHRQQDPDDTTVLVKIPFLHPVTVALACQQRLHVVQVLFQVVRVGNGLEITCQQGLLVIAQNVAQRLIHPHPAPLRGHNGHANGRVTERALEQGHVLFHLVDGQLPLLIQVVLLQRLAKGLAHQLQKFHFFDAERLVAGYRITEVEGAKNLALHIKGHGYVGFQLHPHINRVRAHLCQLAHMVQRHRPLFADHGRTVGITQRKMIASADPPIARLHREHFVVSVLNTTDNTNGQAQQAATHLQISGIQLRKVTARQQ